MLDIVFSDPAPFASIRERQDVARLVETVLGQASVKIGASYRNTVSLERLSGGRSGAHIFKARRSADAGPASESAPVVVKVAPRDAGRRERRSYERFVRPFLPAACRPDLLGFAEAGDRAALCFSFAGKGEYPETLTRRLAVGDWTALELVLSTICEPLQRSWYGPAQMAAEADLARYYLNRYFGTLSAAIAAEDALLHRASLYFDAEREGAGFRIDETLFPSACRTLFGRHDGRPYRSCILHGDLNSDNIIVDGANGSAQLIDFERTGRGHVLQDLVSLEASVRINHPGDASFRDIWEIERSIAQDGPIVPANGYATAIARIRALARRYFGPVEAPTNYAFAVAAVGLRLMKATDLTDAAQARISASALWAVRALAEGA